MKKTLLITAFVSLLSISFAMAQELTERAKISGYVFGDYFYNIARDTGISSISNAANNGAKDFNGFQLRRIYFTYDYTISEKFSMRLRLAHEPKSYASDAKLAFFVKDAFLKCKDVWSGSDIIIGIQPTPTWDISEEVWGNRFLERTIMDIRGYAASRDFGISLKGKIDGEGMFRYWLMLGNNSGSAAEIDKYKRYYALVQFMPVKQLTTTFYADMAARPSINDSTSSSTVSNNDLLYALFFGYKEKDAYMVGIEGFLSQRQNGMVSNGILKDRLGMGLSVFASYNFTKELAVVGRYGYYDPNTDSYVKGDSRNWFIFSLNYKPNEKVTISPNVIIETYESIPNGRSINPSITPRITFFYTFL